jgi:hypothetical protein
LLDFGLQHVFDKQLPHVPEQLAQALLCQLKHIRRWQAQLDRVHFSGGPFLKLIDRALCAYLILFLHRLSFS